MDVSADDHHELRRGSTMVALGILASRVTGLLREVATATFLGVGVGAEALKAALRIPNLLQNLLGEGVLSASFVPVYSRAIADERHDDAGRLAGAVAGLLFAVASVIVVITVAFAPSITRALAWGFDPGSVRYELTVTLVRIVTPGVGLLVLSAWCLGILNSHRRFFLSYVAPVLWNISIIVALVTATLVTTTQWGLARAMAIGALVGSAAQFLIQVPTVRKVAPRIRPSLSLHAPGVRTVVRRFGQVLAGRGSVQIGSYIDLVAASLLAAGGVAALTYAQGLYLLPIALFGMSVAAAELPALSTMDHEDRIRVVARLDAGLQRVSFFVIPTTVAFVLAGEQIVTLILRWGRFSPGAAIQVGAVLSAYGLGLLASTWSRLLQSALYGSGDARTPAIFAAVRVVISLAAGIALMLPLDAFGIGTDGVALMGEVEWSVADPAERDAVNSLLRLGAVGIALGAALGSWVEFALLRRRISVAYGRTRTTGTHGRELGLSGLVAVAVAVTVRFAFAWLDLSGHLAALISLLLIGGGYVLTARLLQVPEAIEITDRLGLRRQ